MNSIFLKLNANYFILVVSNKKVFKSFILLATIIAMSSGTIFSQSIQIRGGNRVVTSTKRQQVSDDNLAQTTSEISKMERKLFDLVNQKRADKGLNTLIWSEDLVKVARLHSRNMVTYNFFSHYGRDNSSVVDRANSLGFNKWQSIGENIAYTSGFDNPVEFTLKQWTLSASHKKNFLDKKWSKAAIGIAKAKDDTFYFTEVFVD